MAVTSRQLNNNNVVCNIPIYPCSSLQGLGRHGQAGPNAVSHVETSGVNPTDLRHVK